VFEVVHDQQHVDAVLKRAQVHRVGEVISDIEAHPMVELAHDIAADWLPW
jgi:hypothetical protein